MSKLYSTKKKLASEEKKIFLDIGFERTSIFTFNSDKFEFFKSIPVGGNNITKDISTVLKLNLDYSEYLKIKFNKLENDLTFNKSGTKEINPYSETVEKNIPIDLFKKIVEARVDEIIELALLECDPNKNLNTNSKITLIIIGGGSKLLLNSYNLSINKSVFKLISYHENDSDVCVAGLDYHKSAESFLIKTKKKPKKAGFFENFFNLFSK